MGYRSDVYMCILGPKEVLLTEVATLRLQGDQAMQAALDEWKLVAAVKPDEAVLVLGGQGTDWKWYSDSPDVRAHLAIFEHFEKVADDDLQVSGVFARLGEDDTDAETRAFNDGYEMGNVVRSIDRAYDGTGPDLRPRLANSSRV